MMTRALRCTVLAVPLLAAAAVFAQSPGCPGVQFSAEVLSRFPDAAAACLDVIQKDGEQYGVFKAQLLDVRGNTVRVRVKKPDGTQGPVASFAAKPGRKVLIDGKAYPLSELAPNQEITAYVRVDRAYIALPPATQSERLDAVPLPEAPAPERHSMRLSSAPTMPHTASSLGAVALLGQFCVAIALSLMVVRKRRK